MQDYFGSRSPLGQHIRLGRPGAQTPPIGIVGVADDVVYTWVDQVPKPAVYLSLNQFPLDAGIYMVHTAGDPASLAASASQVISHLDNAVPLDSIESYRQYLHESLIGLWYVAYQLAVDAGIALFLCVLGIFSVMANLVTERTHEIGIRFALGTDRWSITRLMLGRGLLVTLLGWRSERCLPSKQTAFSAASFRASVASNCPSYSQPSQP